MKKNKLKIYYNFINNIMRKSLCVVWVFHKPGPKAEKSPFDRAQRDRETKSKNPTNLTNTLNCC